MEQPKGYAIAMSDILLVYGITAMVIVGLGWGVVDFIA